MADLNEAMAELLHRLNQRRFRKREGTRASLFESIDRPALQPLPSQPYWLAEWKTVRPNIDYHVEIDRHWSLEGMFPRRSADERKPSSSKAWLRVKF